MASTNEAVSGGDPSEKQSLYSSRAKAYPRYFNAGIFRRLKWLGMVAMLGFFWLAPWIRWDRGPGAADQAILIDLPGRRAYFFFIEIWPQEVYYLTGILIIAALGLFFVSALLGRVWCGFACWQTVFTDLFVWFENLFQGDRNRRMMLDREGFTFNKLWRKAATHLCWILVSLAFGLGFVLYFENAPTAALEIFTAQSSTTMYGTIALMASFCYLLAGFVREDVCVYMCPYSRFQGAMFDEHSMIVSYEAWRGEPRGYLKGGLKGRTADEAFAGRGHCVDCKMCVQVCPTGIDIRDGSQLACIGCALCVDACNSIMDRFGLPHGLISYDSQYNMQARAIGDAKSRTKLLRPRVYVYMAVISLVAVVMTYSLSTRKTFDLNVLHERSPVYVELSGNRIRNGYVIKVLDMVRGDGHFALSLSGVEGATMSIIGMDGDDQTEVKLTTPGDDVSTYRLFVTAPKGSLTGKSANLTFSLTNLDTGRVVRHDNIFAGPEQ